VRQHVLLSYKWGTGHAFWRGRLLKTFTNRCVRVRETLWPPIKGLSSARANLQGEAILYVGDHGATVIAKLCGVNTLPMT
jgi:hypothetical protein